MIIDLRTRIWSNLDQLGPEIAPRLRVKYAERWQNLDGSPASHESAMGCVDAAIVFGYSSRLLQAAVPNELIAEFVAADPSRRLGVAGIDPMSPDASDELESAIALGLIGIAVSPMAQGFHPSHSAAMRLYERCDELCMPVFFVNDVPPTRSTTMEFARPSSLDEVGRSFPDLKMVVGEFGWPWVDETIALVDKHPNVYTDVAGIASKQWHLFQALLSASASDVMEKVLFGSGFPFETPTHAIENMYSLNAFSHGTQLPSVPRSQVRSIVERDALAVLGIDSALRTSSGKARALPLQTGESGSMQLEGPAVDPG